MSGDDRFITFGDDQVTKWPLRSSVPPPASLTGRIPASGRFSRRGWRPVPHPGPYRLRVREQPLSECLLERAAGLRLVQRAVAGACVGERG
jgi:hypothetical protein